jgi:serine/threonine-protein kinase
VAVIALGFGIFNAGRAWSALHPPAATIPVGTYAGSPLPQAQRAVFVADLDERTVPVEDPSAPEGRVVRQDPPPGRLLPDHGVVTLYVASPPMVTIPDVEGADVKDAEQRLAATGLRFHELHEYSTSVPAGHIVKEIPGAGNPVRRAYPVRLIVSDGP